MNKRFFFGFMMTFLMVFILSGTGTAKADTFGSGEFDVVEESNGIGTYATWFGTAGSSTLISMDSGRAFTWGFTLNVKVPVVFTGTIDIYTQGNIPLYRGTVYISGGSAIGQVSGTDYIPKSLGLKKGVNYTARYSGTAVGPRGEKYHVVKGASINFHYR